ncbi:MAG: nucleoside hydrolase [Verrucomicrobiales bacterium]|nr:nucleoside hydrolase [bacterium]MDF2376165.1 nucleoside hydrolase [Verrucomicrobiales bacterium]
MKALFFSLAAFPLLLQAEPVQVIFDTDMASDCDDAGALAVLHALADRGEVEILAVVTNRKCPGNSSAGAADAINTWYGRPDIPLGTDKDGAKTPPQWNNPSSYTSILHEEFPNDAPGDDELPDALDVYLETLRAQPDGSVIICSVGALSNLEDLVRADKELIQAKVKELCVMGGGFPRTHRFETNIRLDPAAAVTVTNEWPTPITWQGFEVGNAMYNGQELIDAPKENPVRRAYELRPFRGGNSLDRGKPNHDLATVLLAVRGPQPEHWTVVEKGRVLIDSDGGTEWRHDRPKNHRYVVIKQHPGILTDIIGELLAAQPGKP